jgi:hypothetical protein
MVSQTDSGNLNVALNVAASINMQDGSRGALNVASEDFEDQGRNLAMGRQMASMGEVATVVVFVYLCAGELLPAIFWKGKDVPKPFERIFDRETWALQQSVLLALISCLIVFLGCCSGSRCPPGGGTGMFFSYSLAMLNIVPNVLAALVTYNDTCGVDHWYEGCDHLSILFDSVGLVAAKLYRLDLGILMLLAARGHSAWLFGATGGRRGYAEALALLR